MCSAKRISLAYLPMHRITKNFWTFRLTIVIRLQFVSLPHQVQPTDAGLADPLTCLQKKVKKDTKILQSSLSTGLVRLFMGSLLASNLELWTCASCASGGLPFRQFWVPNSNPSREFSAKKCMCYSTVACFKRNTVLSGLKLAVLSIEQFAK